MRRPTLNAALPALLALITAALLARLLLLLLAADPANPAVAALLALTEPLAAPLAWIDAEQPRFGSRFERGTLLLIMLFLGGGTLLLRRLGRTTGEEAHR